MNESLANGEITFKRPEGIDRKYLTVKELRDPEFKIDKNKVEGGIQLQPDGLFTLQERKQEKEEEAKPYEKTTNAKFEKPKNDYPKVTFTAKEVYE